MKKIKNRCAIIVFLMSLSLSFSAHASDPGGWWTSSTGSKIHIWANMQQVIVTVHAQNGQQFKYQGRWTRFSDYFSYQVPGSGVNNCAFAQNNPNIIYVQDPAGRRYTWTRGVSQQTQRPQVQQQKQSQGIAGTWRSTSSSTIQISLNNKQIFLNFITANGSRFQGAGRWLSGYTFDYSIPGYDGVAECTVDKNNWNIIYCLYKGKRTTWNKVQ